MITDRGYDGATGDLWSCRVILFLLLTRWLSFEDRNLAALYKKVLKLPNTTDLQCFIRSGKTNQSVAPLSVRFRSVRFAQKLSRSRSAQSDGCSKSMHQACNRSLHEVQLSH